MNIKLLKDIMNAHEDHNKDLAAALGMSAPNFSTIWNGRADMPLKHIKATAARYEMTPQQVYDVFIAN